MLRILFALSILAGGFQAHAQGSVYSVVQEDQHKTKIKGDKVIERDKSKPVRRTLEQQYEKIAEAQRNKDLEALRALRTPDFTVSMPNGEIWDLEASLSYSHIGFEQVQSNIRISNTIDSLSVHGDTAVVVVHQRWSRMQTKRGALRLVETEAVQTETWVHTPNGWKLNHIANIRPGVWMIDGKRVDPGKPYDPDAPPYNPDAKESKQ